MTRTEEPSEAPAAPPLHIDDASHPEPKSDQKTELVNESQPLGPQWPELADDHPLSKFCSMLPKIIAETGYNEVYGIQLIASHPGDSFHNKLILQKFLRANANDLDKAVQQLKDTLLWRKEYQPLKVMEAAFPRKIFGGLGYVIEVGGIPDSSRRADVVTFNLYGAVEDVKATFQDTDAFLRWRVALMELSLSRLNLSDATEPIPDYGKGPDPYCAYQVHDYNNVSFLRMDPDIRAASKKTIETFQKYYPETLSKKFFVNVPGIMGWVFRVIKPFLAKETVRKFSMLSYGTDLANELGPNVPAVYGGKGANLSEQTAVSVNLHDEEARKAETKQEQTQKAEAKAVESKQEEPNPKEPKQGGMEHETKLEEVRQPQTESKEAKQETKEAN